jgi:hypothetical protein
MMAAISTSSFSWKDGKAMQHQLTNLASAITLLFNRAAGDFGPESEVLMLLATAHDLVRDAALIAATPELSRAHCMSIHSGIHALKPGTDMETVCGARFQLTERILFQFRVPTCPHCVAALVGDTEPMKG